MQSRKFTSVTVFPAPEELAGSFQKFSLLLYSFQFLSDIFNIKNFFKYTQHSFTVCMIIPIDEVFIDVSIILFLLFFAFLPCMLMILYVWFSKFNN